MLEALGCLIPGAFHPRNDGKKPRGKAVREPGLAVQLQAGTWKVDAFEEQALTGLAPGVEGLREQRQLFQEGLGPPLEFRVERRVPA